MASPAQGALALLTSAGVVVTTGTGFYGRVSRRTESPDAQVVMMDTGGLTPNTKWLLSFPTIQAIVRGNKDGYEAAWAKAKEVQDVLLGLEPQDVNGDRWSGVVGIGDIGTLGYDDQNRPMLSVNFRVLLEPATSALTNRESL